MPDDYYSILGVDRDAPARMIQRAFRRLALLYHPDLNKEAGAEDTFKKINQAYQILSDGRQREAYNRFWDSSPYAERRQRSGQSLRTNQEEVGAQQPSQSSHAEPRNSDAYRQAGQDSPRAGERGQGYRGRPGSTGARAGSGRLTEREIRALNRVGCLIGVIVLVFVGLFAVIIVDVVA